ncbi:oligosaccharyl transferase, archaeosortase A system-associated [Halosegnis marinus]|uniref:dolichyl-phosphooligosaccharide-protein glycotransferase n=1 Tax=Halosegnis marinus TaxID=3034023 RepID=A0ABD5ZL39_9EURY|nr:oligosaccharyl transferase, archaeosortase A system-associated [Halosegnis sp. DT85]
MSSRSEQRADGGDRSVLDRVRDSYHVPLLALAVAFSLWVRTRGWRNFVVDGRVLYSGNDAWYHYRMVQYTVEHWPFTMPFDPWTEFPTGTFVGQFGTLYDQIIATAALVVGLGSPTTQQVAMTHLFAPAVFGAFALVPAYLFARQVVGREGALVSVLFLTLTTGQFLSRGLVGFSDHHIAEVFFILVAVAAVAKSLRVSMAEKPVWELVTAREFEPLRPVVAWGALAGLGIALYLWTWPPGVFLLGVLGLFFALAASVYQATGVSPDHVAATGIVAGTVAGVLTLATVDTFDISATTLSLLQPALAFALALGCVFLAGFARVWDTRGLDRSLYPVGVVGVGVVGLGLFAVVLPSTFGFFADQVLRIFGYTSTAGSRTVAEAQPVPLESVFAFFSSFYGFGLFTAIAGGAFMAYKAAVADEARADRLFVLVLAVLLFLAAITQRRFEYYFAIPVAVLNGYLAAVVFDLVDLGEALRNAETPSGYQVMAVLSVVMLVAAPMAVGARTAPNVANASASPGEVGLWTGSLDWMEDNTPEMGAYGDGSPSDLEYLGSYERTDDFQYDEGEYGTLAWWDYGHWITVLGHRVPNANPFQANADYSANVLLAPNESTATTLMENGGSEETRYVMVDYQLGVPGTRKYAAPTAWEDRYGLSQTDARADNDIARTIYNVSSNGQARVAYNINTPRGQESLRVRLFQYNGAAQIPDDGQTFVFDYETTVNEGRLFYVTPANGPVVRSFQNRSAAEEFVEQDGSAQIGGLDGFPSEYVPALEHYRLVHASQASRFDRTSRNIYPAVKTFERVPGANVTVEGPANTNVTATVQMRMTTRNQTFTYRQRARTDENGVAEFTLPYATTGDDEWGLDEGYTNTSVVADGPYEFATPQETNESTLTTTVFNATGDVSEGQVLGEDDSTTTVELTRTVVDEPEGANTTNTTNDTQGLLTTPTEPTEDDTAGTAASLSGPTTFAARPA